MYVSISLKFPSLSHESLW